jgi:hypothetical protein
MLISRRNFVSTLACLPVISKAIAKPVPTPSLIASPVAAYKVQVIGEHGRYVACTHFLRIGDDTLRERKSILLQLLEGSYNPTISVIEYIDDKVLNPMFLFSKERGITTPHYLLVRKWWNACIEPNGIAYYSC